MIDQDLEVQLRLGEDARRVAARGEKVADRLAGTAPRGDGLVEELDVGGVREEPPFVRARLLVGHGVNLLGDAQPFTVSTGFSSATGTAMFAPSSVSITGVTGL